MSEIKIIGISGPMGSGKDEFAEIFAKNSQIACERHAFADKIREITELMFGVKMQETHKAGEPFYNQVMNYTQSDKNIMLPGWDKTIGECLQLIGTDLFRLYFDPDTWVKSTFGTSGKECLKRGNILLIPDVRFPNEADAIKERDGIVIRLEGDPMDARKNSKRDLNHISETALNGYTGFHSIIDNSEPGLDIFTSKIKDFMTKIEINQK